MSKTPPPDSSPNQTPPASLPKMDIDQWLETLRRSDRSFYNMMALEVWSIAKTMDGLVPGFWNRFMLNRRVSLETFLQQKASQRGQGNAASPPHAASPDRDRQESDET